MTFILSFLSEALPWIAKNRKLVGAVALSALVVFYVWILKGKIHGLERDKASLAAAIEVQNRAIEQMGQKQEAAARRGLQAAKEAENRLAEARRAADALASYPAAKDCGGAIVRLSGQLEGVSWASE